MIEIKNFKMFDDQKAIRENKFSRAKSLDRVLSVGTIDSADDDGHFSVKTICEYGPNIYASFETYEKADAFYDALTAMLPDSHDKKQTIDILDFE